MERTDAPSRRAPRWRALVGALAALALVAGGLVTGVVPKGESASAANGAAFNAGMIISDAAFYNASAMTAAQVQSFLNGKVASCVSGYTCLKDFTQTTTTRAASPYCSTYTGVADQSAAVIIWSVAQACGVNPQVLLVLLQKEQSLVTSTSPGPGRYQSATGYGCPDTAPCDAEYYGFFNQVYNAARQFKYYQANPNSYGYRAGRVNTILWNPNPACGTSDVYIVNQATAGLYIYTPYRPNDAALANIYGVGDSCSSYGNRNFWAYFTDWFGELSGPPPTPTANPTTGEPANYLLAQATDGTQWLYPYLSANTLAPRGQVGTGWGSMAPTFSVGDFNRDGKQDIFATDVRGDLWMYSRDGSGGWLPRVQVGSGWFFTAIFPAGDFTGDGNPDVWARDSAGALWLYPGNGGVGFLPRIRGGSGWQVFGTLFSPGDFSGDGFSDVLALDGFGGLWLYPGDGNGGWLPWKQIGSGWQNFSAVFAAGDFNRDGTADVFAREPNGDLFLYPGDGASNWILPRVQAGSGWQTMTSIFSVGVFPVAGATPDPALVSSQNFVKQLYLDFLGRAATTEEVASGSSRIMSNQVSRFGLANELALSDEWISTVIAGFYRNTLNREPDAAGLRGWIDAARGGMPVAQIASAFYASPEYFTTVGLSDNRTWVTDLYAKLLLRAPDAAGLDGWVTQLDNGMARDTLTFGFYQSTETLGVRVNSLYQTFLGRDGEPAGIANWVPFVASKGDLVLAAALAGSKEYFNRAQTLATP